MRNIGERDYTRRPGFLRVYREEAERMHRAPAPQPTDNLPKAPDNTQDMAVLLPILLLLMREGADRWLLLALVYILL